MLSPLRRLLQAPRDVVDPMRLSAGDRVLELGCGPGYFSPELARAVPAGSLVLFDLQAQMLSHARKRLSNASNVDYARGDATQLPFADHSFDAALLVYVLGEVPDPSACVRELSRVLRPGGSATFVETWRDSDFVRFVRLERLTESCGFSLAERSGRWSYVARFQTRAPR